MAYPVDMTNAAVAALPERGIEWTIGKNVAVLLVRTDEPQNKFAAYLGITPQSLSGKLKGKRPWTAREIEKAARHFNVTIDSLFKKLPEMDSNHQPAGSSSAPVISLDQRRRQRLATTSEHPAPVTPPTHA